MTTKKKVGISDLLRDEVQKDSESLICKETATEQTIEVKAEIVSDAASKVSNPLAINIADLERSLSQSQQREKELSKTVADLQKDLQFSRTNVELLQKSLAAIESLKYELEQQLVEVKRDNLRLAEANIQISERVKSLESIKELPQALVNEPLKDSQLVSQAPQNNRATPRKQPVEQPYPHRDRNPYARPTGSNEQLQKINNKNIGWMD